MDMDKEAHVAFGTLVRRYRIAVGLTQEELAERSGVSPRAISEIERGGASVPRRSTVELLADALELSPDERATLVATLPSRKPATPSATPPSSMPAAPTSYDVDAPGASEPALGPTPVTALPAALTPLIGREHEEAAVAHLLRHAREGSSIRLLTLTGPGGVGKTRLALRVAAGLANDFPDGVVFVPLAPLADPTLVLPAIAQGLTIRETPGRTVQETVQVDVRDKRLLLLLDNFEHLLPAALDIAALLRACPLLTVLATSRTVLHIAGEHTFEVPPLAVPDLRQLPSETAVEHVPAVALFMRRARAVRPDFALTPALAPTVAEICVRLDGLPLAIELAAARMRLLSAPALLARLDDRFRLLTGGARDLDARQQTLRGALDWSYGLLNETEQRLFARLAVFAGSAALDAVEAVCDAAGDLKIDALDGLESLLNKSLLRRAAVESPDPRVVMLETMRAYAWEQLAARGETEQTRQAHADYYVALAEEAEPHLIGPEQVTWLARLEAEHDNLRAALAWVSERDSDRLARLTGTLDRFWAMRGHITEGRVWLDIALERAAPESPHYARVLRAAGLLAKAQGDYHTARHLFERGIAVYEALGDKRNLASLITVLALLVHEQGDTAYAATLHEQSIGVARELGETHDAAIALSHLAVVKQEQGDYAGALPLHEKSVSILRATGDKKGLAVTLGNQGLLYREMGDIERATALCHEVLDIMQELGDKGSTAIALNNLGDLLHERGDDVRAAETLTESLVLYRELGLRWGFAYALEGLATVSTAVGQPVRAARLFGAATALRASLGMPRPHSERVRYERTVLRAQALLGQERFDDAFAAGEALSVEQAIHEALTSTPASGGPSHMSQPSTPRL